MATGQIVEQVAEGFEEAAVATRQINTDFLGGFGTGLIVGFAIGFYFGHRWNKEKIRAEEIKKSQEEVDAIREFYKTRYSKPSPEQVVEEKGYIVAEEPGVYDVELGKVTLERPLKPPVPVVESERHDGWDYSKEVPTRNRNHPYVIHQDEFNAKENEYTQLTWTYWGGDDILADEHEEIVTRPELVVGLENLTKFGHGSDDDNVVFVRSDKLQIEWEICRILNKSYVEEVQGLDLNNPVPDDDDNEPDET